MTTNRLLQLIKGDLPAVPPTQEGPSPPPPAEKSIRQRRASVPHPPKSSIPDLCIHKSGIPKYCIPALCIHNNGILNCETSLARRWYKRNEYIDDLLLPTLSPTDQAIYNQLYSGSWRKNRNWYRISLGKLASKANTSIESSRKAINRLIEKGYISLVESNKVSGNLYRVFLPEEVEALRIRIPVSSIPEQESIHKNGIPENGILSPETTLGQAKTPSIPESCIPDSGNMVKNNTEQKKLSLQTVLDQFYQAIAQPKISKSKKLKGERDLKELLRDFPIEDIAYAAKWTARHKKDVRDFSLIKHTIGEALAARDREEKRRQQRTAQKHMEAARIADQAKADEERTRRMEKSPYRGIWEKVEEQLRGKMVSQSFSSWITLLYISSIEDDTVVIDCPSAFVLDLLEETYRGSLEEAMREIEGKEMEIVLVCEKGVERRREQ